MNGKAVKKGHLGSQFGLRNKLLCLARKAHREGLSFANFVKEANELAPLTAKEKLNIERAI